MRLPKPMTAVGLALLTALAGCEPEPEPATETAIAVQRAAVGGNALLPPEVISQLKEEYPVLRKDPAPAPRPSPDASPEEIPDRVSEARPQVALESVQGEATFYADKFEGRRTASGIPFRQNQMVAAHRAYPFGTLLRVTNLRNDRSVNVRVVDRGPFGATTKKRKTIIDLSRRAATQLGYIGAGRTPVQVEVLEWGEGLPRVS